MNNVRSAALYSMISLFLGLRENDLVDEEEYYHADATVEYCSANVVNKCRNELAGNSNPDAVDGVNDACDNNECHYIPCNLLAWLIVVTEYKKLLDWEVNALTNYHSDHISYKVCKTAMSLIISKDVPLKGLSK